MADIIIDAIHNPDKPRPEGEVLLGELARQYAYSQRVVSPSAYAVSRFWAWGMQTCTVTARKHLEEAFTDYLNSVHDQALDRDTNNLRTVENYFRTRRENTGARPSYIPAVMEIDVPDEAFYHPGVVKLSYLSTDLILLDNVINVTDIHTITWANNAHQDLASYNKEQATGDDRHNILTIVMKQFGYTLDEALKWTANRHEEVQARFLDGMKRLPSFGPDVDPRLQQYIQAIATGPRANDCWNFESGRYFGSKGLEIQSTRIVPILPKVVVDNRCTLRRENVVVPLVDLYSNSITSSLHEYGPHHVARSHHDSSELHTFTVRPNSGCCDIVRGGAESTKKAAFLAPLDIQCI